MERKEFPYKECGDCLYRGVQESVRIFGPRTGGLNYVSEEKACKQNSCKLEENLISGAKALSSDKLLNCEVLTITKRCKMKLIFVCKHNVFRSRVAEAYFKKINKNPRIKVISRGIIMGGEPDYQQARISKDVLGIDINKRKPIPLKIPEMVDADLIVVVANDIPKVVFDYQLAPIEEKVVIWNVKDEQLGNKKNIKNILLLIKRKVDKLIKNLENKK
ncbi:hypothetical protein HY448_00860 [Candidatus Pacearchaeota archaeon]|nr:hypothetical protein [Candidatus Pacearchaeota archaeon]